MGNAAKTISKPATKSTAVPMKNQLNQASAARKLTCRTNKSHENPPTSSQKELPATKIVKEQIF